MKRWITVALAPLAAAALLTSCSRSSGDQLQVGGAIALTGNAGLLGQDARTGLELAQQHFGKQAPPLKPVSYTHLTLPTKA